MTDLNLQARWIEYSKRGGDLSEVPDKFRNQEIQDLFLKRNKC